MTKSVAVAVMTLLTAGEIASAADVECPSTAGADTHPTFDATRLKEGRFIYRTTLKGELLGETALEIRRDGGRFVISMTAPEIAQSWKATVERSFAPISAMLQMQGKKGAYEMSVRYAGDTVTGEERDAGIARPVNARTTGLTIDQRVDWAAIMATTASAQTSIALRVFDPTTGSSAMLGRVGGVQALRGAWGEIDALRLDYSICKRAHLEEYTVYATSQSPRYMLREDMPNGLVSELVRIEP